MKTKKDRSEYHKQWRLKNKERRKEYHQNYYRKSNAKDDKPHGLDRYLRKTFNISLEDYNSMFEAQSGKCAICSIEQSESKSRFAVDHCHLTGKVRGLLCGNCNRGLGMFKDNTDSLTKAILYLTT